MRQAVIKIKTHILNFGIFHTHFRQLALNALLASLGGLALCYVIFLGNMVWNIVERRTLEAELRTLSTEVATLELTYLSKSDKIDLPLSYSLGFKEAQAQFTARKSLGSLSVVNNEI